MPDRIRGRLQGCRVLIVEDEYFLADDLARAFRAHGAEVIGPIAERSEAKSRLDYDGFDVAVIDIMLRDEAAYPIADELVSQGIPFGFATGYRPEAIPYRFRDVKRWEKPYDVPVIVNEVAQLWRSGRAV
jgi:DNA-binding NtrC family response regulator